MAFFGCSNLTSIKIGKGLHTVPANAFANSSVLKYDFTAFTSIPVLSDSEIFKDISSDCKIVVSDDLYDSWILAKNWSTYSNYIIKESEYNHQL